MSEGATPSDGPDDDSVTADASAAMDGAAMSEAWKDLALRVLEAADASGARLSMRRVSKEAHIQSRVTDTEVLVWVDRSRRAVMVAFRPFDRDD